MALDALGVQRPHVVFYAFVSLPEGKMSSREGTVVSYRELRDEAVRRATEITREKLLQGSQAGRR